MPGHWAEGPQAPPPGGRDTPVRGWAGGTHHLQQEPLASDPPRAHGQPWAASHSHLWPDGAPQPVSRLSPWTVNREDQIHPGPWPGLWDTREEGRARGIRLLSLGSSAGRWFRPDHHPHLHLGDSAGWLLGEAWPTPHPGGSTAPTEDAVPPAARGTPTT